MARATSTLSRVNDAAVDNLERTGVDPQRVAAMIADSRDHALKLGQEAIERAAEQRRQAGETVRGVIEQLPSVSVEVTLQKPGRLARRETRIALIVAGAVLLALAGVAVAKLVGRRRAGG